MATSTKTPMPTGVDSAPAPETTVESTPLGGQRPIKEALQGDALQAHREDGRANAIASLGKVEAACIEAAALLLGRNDQYAAKQRSFIAFTLGQCEHQRLELTRI